MAAVFEPESRISEVHIEGLVSKTRTKLRIDHCYSHTSFIAHRFRFTSFLTP